MEDLFLDGAQKSLESSRCSELSVRGLLSAAAKVQWDSKYSIKILLTIPWDLGTTTGRLDTGHFFLISLTQGLLFKAYSKVKNPKVGSFLRAPEDFEGLRSRKEKITKIPSFFGKKIN